MKKLIGQTVKEIKITDNKTVITFDSGIKFITLTCADDVYLLERD
tara:strand:- start:14 stop:148 length:135 start_codon:yes stop_codon:yes gene_type:complete